MWCGRGLRGGNGCRRRSLGSSICGGFAGSWSLLGLIMGCRHRRRGLLNRCTFNWFSVGGLSRFEGYLSSQNRVSRFIWGSFGVYRLGKGLAQTIFAFYGSSYQALGKAGEATR